MITAYHFYASRFLSRKNTDGGSRRVRTAVLTVALSLVPLVTVLEVSSGMIDGITGRYLEVGSFHAQVRFFETLEDTETDRIIQSIEQLDFVRQVHRVCEGVGMAYDENGRTGVSIRGYDPALFVEDEQFLSFLTLSNGVREKFSRMDEGFAVLSELTMSELAISEGDELRLLSARKAPNKRFLLKQAHFTVAGTFSSGYADLDGATVIVPISEAQKMFPDADATYLGIKVDNPFGDIAGAVRTIQTLLPDDSYAYSWRDLERGMYTTFRTTKSLLIIVMAVIAAVAVITVSSSLIMLVTERETEIALLKSVGATGRGIQRIFVTLGFLSGAVGTAIGLAIGVFVSIFINEIFSVIESVIGATVQLIASVSSRFIDLGEIEILNPAFYLEEIPIQVHFFELFLVSVLSLLLTTLSAWLPARRAARIRPIASLSKH